MKRTFDPHVEKGLAKIVNALGKDFPEVMAILDSAQHGELLEQEAMAALMRVANKEPKMAERLMVIAKEAFLPTRGAGQALVPKADLAETGDMAFWSGVGLPQLNPLIEAALAERAQFDGDMPELRTGPLAPGVVPAVPVTTRARSPEVIGVMLKVASEKVRAAQDEADVQVAKAIERVAKAKALAGIRQSAGALAVMEAGDIDLFRQAHGSADTDIKMYRRGELPKPLEVAPPSGGALVRMTSAERKESAWRFLSTSQGRRTAVETLRDVILETLQKSDIRPVIREYDPRKKTPPLAYHEWKVNLSGRGSMQPAFNVIEVAGKAIATSLAQRVLLEDPQPNALYLEVIPVDTVDIRSVGWAARLVVGGIKCLNRSH